MTDKFDVGGAERWLSPGGDGPAVHAECCRVALGGYCDCDLERRKESNRLLLAACQRIRELERMLPDIGEAQSLRQRNERLEAENAQLLAENRTVCCVYCGNVRTYKDRDSMLDSMAEHAAKCEKSPLLQLLEKTERNERLERALRKAVDQLEEFAKTTGVDARVRKEADVILNESGEGGPNRGDWK